MIYIVLIECFNSEMIDNNMIFVYYLTKKTKVKKRGCIVQNHIIYCYQNNDDVYIYNSLNELYNNVNDDLYNKFSDIKYSQFLIEEKRNEILIKKSVTKFN
jgi:hypothetical protein